MQTSTNIEKTVVSVEDKKTIAYQYLTSQVMPCNSIVALRELRQELDKAQTNCLDHAQNWKTKALILFLADQVYGQLGLDTFKEYSSLVKEIGA